MNSVGPYYKYVLLALLFMLQATNLMGDQKADEVLVIKSEKRLYLMNEGEAFASYHVAFGSNPKGHKQEQGDGRTPEGRYILDFKNAGSAYFKSIHISYPNAKDRIEARKRGVDPGGDIMIHGQKNGYGPLSILVQRFNWTNGCIALSDRDMEQVWMAIDPGTPIEIRP
ncbi:MAG: L,D-transpeptidase family protein [Deltaproteobacteria bacterium]|jgi:murein L,D-transpeptidase YafK|nr:L,D-transpeptidase family protein [Deltaproteobacteria bacterium]